MAGFRTVVGERLEVADTPLDSNAAASPHRRPIKVLILIPSMAVGGAETDLTRTLPKLDRTRFNVTVCTFLLRGELGKALQDHGIEVVGPFTSKVRLPRQFVRWIRRQRAVLVERVAQFRSAMRAWKRKTWFANFALLENVSYVVKALFSPLKYVLRKCSELAARIYSSIWAVSYLSQVAHLARPIADYMRTSEFDVIHTILPNSYLVGAYANFLAGRRPILMSRLSSNLYQHEQRLLGFLERHVLHRHVDIAVGNSRAILQELSAEGIHESKLRLVHNGIDVPRFENEMIDRATARRLLDIPDNTLVFSVVANLHSYKGHRDLLDSFRILARGVQFEWLCLIAGADIQDNLAKLQRLCLNHGLSRHIRFLGPRNDVPVILSASDIHISASHQEGLPNSIIEAMCARLPIVATAVGGVPELVVNGQTGYLVPPHDAGQMAEALFALAQAPDQRKSFGASGYARVKNGFDIDRNAAAFEAIYDSLAQRTAAIG